MNRVEDPVVRLIGTKLRAFLSFVAIVRQPRLVIYAFAPK